MFQPSLDNNCVSVNFLKANTAMLRWPHGLSLLLVIDFAVILASWHCGHGW